MVCPDERARVAREHNDRQRPEDGVDGAAFEPELAQVRPREQSVWGLEELLRRVMLATRRPLGPVDSPLSSGAAWVVQSSRLS